MRLPISLLDDAIEVAGTGFTVLDRIYADGDLTDEALGGSCGNVLVSLAMLQRHVAPVLALGDDNEGERLIEEFSQAGASVRFISRRAGVRSPILAQELDTATGTHDFSFRCPVTREDLPRYQSIDDGELSPAMPVLSTCFVFYADRVSPTIIEAMKTASSGGAIIFFEPSDVDQEDLFEAAVQMASIVKYSADRLGARLEATSSGAIRIVTHGAAGLEIADESGRVWCDAIPAASVLDTCGCGDMVSVGLIDWMIAHRPASKTLHAAGLVGGVVAGQRLAAENCGYAGARGVFKARGAEYARGVLSRETA